MIKALFWFLLFCQGHLLARDVYVHLFVHGTTLPGFLLLSQAHDKPVKYDDKYVSFIEKSRNDTRFYDDSIMLDCGLVPISSQLVSNCKKGTLDSWQSRRAAIQAIAAYDDFVDHTHEHYYFVYGWSGLLSDDYRKKEAGKLYNELVIVKNRLRERFGKEPIFIAHGHSHGANIILYLAYQEELQRQKLCFEHVMLYEMPVQTETAHYAKNPMFKYVSLLYSNGDSIQIADSFSTAGGKSYRTFSDLIEINDAPNKIQEVLVTMNGDRKALPHRSYFFFDAYFGLSTVYKNLFGKNAATAFLNPLPLVVLSPVFMWLLQTSVRTNACSCVLNIGFNGNTCAVDLDAEQAAKKYSANLFSMINEIKNRLALYWEPYAKTSDVKKLFWMGQHIIMR